MSQYLEFVQVWNEGEKRKTKIFKVRSKLHGSYLGGIQWYGRWRQYAFFPAEETVFNSGCLDDILQFIRKLMEERRQ